MLENKHEQFKDFKEEVFEVPADYDINSGEEAPLLENAMPIDGASKIDGVFEHENFEPKLSNLSADKVKMFNNPLLGVFSQERNTINGEVEHSPFHESAKRNAKILADINAPWYEKAYDVTIDKFKSIGKGIVGGVIGLFQSMRRVFDMVIAQIKSIGQEDSNVKKVLNPDDISLTKPMKENDILVQEARAREHFVSPPTYEQSQRMEEAKQQLMPGRSNESSTEERTSQELATFGRFEGGYLYKEVGGYANPLAVGRKAAQSQPNSQLGDLGTYKHSDGTHETRL